MAVGVVERVEQLRRDADGVARREPDAALEVVREIVPFDVLHRDIRDLVVLAEVVDRDNPRVPQASSRLGLVAKAGGQGSRLGIQHEVLANGLEGHRPKDVGVEPLVDHPHRTPAQGAGDHVLAQLHGCLHAPSTRQPSTVNGRRSNY